MNHSSFFSDRDLEFMTLAINLAERGRFTTAPNPCVGCVIVKDNNIVGTGYHQKAGQPHAEVYALQQAGELAVNATAYVTLEPCSHFGRTPPCADALIQAGIRRVVVAMQDPNPQVSGQGIARLRHAGIIVEVGLCADMAEHLNRAFFKRMRTGMPYIQLKLAASLDGKIAMASGESKWITSEKARQDVQVFRAQASAILSTHKTVTCDDASLTVRYDELPPEIRAIYPQTLLRQPIRIIIDSQNQLSGNENLFQQYGEIWLATKFPRKLPHANCHLLLDNKGKDHIDLNWLFEECGKKQLNSIWIEAGAHLAGALIEQNLVDELIIYYAPKLLGHNAQNLAVLPTLNLLANAPQFQFKSVVMVGEDLRCILHKQH
ncbi:bifunctional diaminohydroxyphosphoribosylaminopyrimidine deaminase/5-amino-6-(5-phosphoribosylamino)uracil reductase RibD [Frischella perrara]|uniref:bifunctional diaminohydroxyphosphoribosylaminopyrimidine deaminase/5-amino-6-(5-phosphoribosylamino)uracil reductase RibD n=1 Tax=Frischella perrara TaxID=1267021 RepID=UPI0023F0F533|nr:bifunctional diaminohydroxyphosphoribosylaminopyrimidine deaminase/5-amino-6-(5-phosphoribosylamino)uracil reductase RibD [Frischella perrara]